MDDKRRGFEAENGAAVPAPGVVTGQYVTPLILERARAMRHEMTPEEAILWQALRGGRLNGLRFRRQQPIDGYIVDFYCHAVGVIVEVDGGIHAGRREYDEWRDGALSSRGLVIVRVTNSEVNADLDGVLKRIAAACRRGSG